MSHHNVNFDFSNSPYDNENSLCELDREIYMGELRLRYIQLMREAHKTLRKKVSIDLIEESEEIWNKLTS
tara:strand:+ start:216 stop:425 length:210 start_codon:yes stop_codon:yes gene_type:complete